VTKAWRRGRLIDFAELVSTGPFGSMLHKSDYLAHGVPLINPTNIVEESIVPDTEKQVGAEALSRLTAYILKAGDVVVGRRGEIGRCAVVGLNEAGWVCGTGCFFIRPKPTTDPHFLAQLLRSPFYRDRLERASTGSTMKNISNTALAELPVALPPIEEQRRIVAILDEALEGIATAKANAENNLQNARDLFTCGLERVFIEPASTWRRAALESIGTTQTGSTPKSSEPENFGNYLPFVKPGDFNRDGSITLGNEGLSESGARKARHVRANSALMVCIGATIGKAAFTEREISTNQQVNAWTPTADVSPKFIYYQMITADFQRRVHLGSGQATLPIINKSKWSALTVVFPENMDEQVKIVGEFDSLLAESMNLEAIYRRKLAALDALKKSLLHQAFTGQLVRAKTLSCEPVAS
jgi:type I restriction enzyme S subunit